MLNANSSYNFFLNFLIILCLHNNNSPCYENSEIFTTFIRIPTVQLKAVATRDKSWAKTNFIALRVKSKLTQSVMEIAV